MRFNIRVIPSASKNEVVLQEDGSLRVKIASAPINGEANKTLLKILSTYFNLPKDKLTIKQGLRSKNKIIEILA